MSENKIENELTLAKAFRVRNLLKNQIQEFTQTLRCMQKYHAEGTTVDYTNTDNFSPEMMLEAIDMKRIVLNYLNISIEQANQKGPSIILIDIQDIKDRIQTLEEIEGDVTRFPKEFIEENRVTGEKKVSKNIIDIDIPKLRAMIKELKNKKFELETELADLNASTKVQLSANISELGNTPLVEALNIELGLN